MSQKASCMTRQKLLVPHLGNFLTLEHVYISKTVKSKAINFSGFLNIAKISKKIQFQKKILLETESAMIKVKQRVFLMQHPVYDRKFFRERERGRNI